MRARDLETLELPKLLDSLASLAASIAGAERCRALTPTTELGEVERRLAALAEYLDLSAEHPAAPRTDVPDLRPVLALAAHEDAVLEGKDLAAVLAALRVATSVCRYLRRAGRDAAELSSLAARIVYPPEVERGLARAIDDAGHIRDEATPVLAGLRARIRSLRDDLERRLAGLLADVGRDVAAEQYVTLRNNRFVVPVRSNAAHRLAGVIQDRSASGETVFLEPLFAVEVNNRLVLTRKEEEAEERRIRAHLTEEIHRQQDTLTAMFHTLVDCDVLAARAALARRLDATIPVIGASEVCLRCARHPLLILGNRTVTPIDLLLPAGTRGLIVTGPNTGGKTVALKTLGLLALMAQCGLAIPADERSTLPCFASIYADIGDEQSIERNLSTFSSHIANLAVIASHADAHSLVVLDEPGVGTDPGEGAALAVGLLSYLRDRGAFLAASSHSADVKTFALADAAFDVAAVDVDPATGEPRYQLRYHTLGRSLGLQMARRLGLPETVLSAAERQLSEATGPDVARAAERLEATRQVYEQRIAALDTEAAALAAREAEQATLLADLKAKQRSAWHEALAEARTFVQELRAEGQRVLSDLRRSRRPASTLQEAVVAQEEAVAAAAQRHAAAAPSDSTPTIGDQVEVTGQGIRGELVELKGARARIRRGALRFEVPTAALHRVAPAMGKGPGASHSPHQPARPEIRLAEVPAAPAELSLLGLRSREAVLRVEEFLDRAVRAGHLSVRIIHGLGGGALRRAVHDYLGTSPYCASFREGTPAEGGAGVTVAELEI
jgi:DNA mismatch repair protein MutS2